MKRSTALDYRGYMVEPPCEGFRNTWQGLPMLAGMPALTAPSETDLRERIDYAHSLRQDLGCAPLRRETVVPAP